MSILWRVAPSSVIYRRSRYLHKSIKKKIYNSSKQTTITRRHSRIRKINTLTNVNRRSTIRNKTKRRKRERPTIIKTRLWKWFKRKRERIWTKNVGFNKKTFNPIEKFKKRKKLKIKKNNEWKSFS